MRSGTRLALAAASGLVVSALLSNSPATAAVLYWDRNGALPGASAGATAAGTWDTGATANNNWSTSPDGDVATINWTAGDDAVFSAGTNTTGTFAVTMGSAVSANSITVEEGTIQHSATSANTLTTSALTINSGATFSVSTASTFLAPAGSTLTLNGGTIQNRNTGTGNSFLTVTSTNNNMAIVLGTGGGRVSANGGSGIVSIYTGSISGTGPLYVDGTGTFRLTTVVATYTGDTIINGRLQISTTANVLPSGTSMVINAGGEFNAQNSQTVASLSGSGNVTSAGSHTLTIAGTTSTTYSGAVSGTIGVTKNLASQLLLTGANTTTGTLTIGNTAGNSVSIGNGGTIGSWTGSIATTTNGALIFNRSDDFSYNGLISGGGTVTKQGAGTLTINNNDWTNTGGVIISGGQIKFGNSSAGFASTVPVTINNGAALDMNSIPDTFGSLVSSSGNTTGELKLTGNLTLGQTASTARNYFGTITGSAQLTKSGGTWIQTLSGNNSAYSGNIVVSQGILSVGNANALGNTTGTTSVASGAELRVDGAANSHTIAEPISIAGGGAGGGGAVTVQNSAAATFTGPITLTGDATIATSSTATSTFSDNVTGSGFNLTLQGGSGAGGGGTISGNISLGSGGITKLQGGKWVLSGVNSYNGTTTVSAGTLVVNGTHSGAGDYSVASGATLAGAGNIGLAAASNVVTVNGTLAPGNSIGTLNVLTGDVTLAGIANFEIDLDSSTFDKLTVGDLLTYGGTLNVIFSGTAPVLGGSYDLFDFFDKTGEFATINFSGGTFDPVQTASFNHATGVVTVTAVPEPAALSLLGIGALGLLARRRRAAY